MYNGNEGLAKIKNKTQKQTTIKPILLTEDYLS